MESVSGGIKLHLSWDHIKLQRQKILGQQHRGVYCRCDMQTVPIQCRCMR